MHKFLTGCAALAAIGIAWSVQAQSIGSAAGIPSQPFNGIHCVHFYLHGDATQTKYGFPRGAASDADVAALWAAWGSGRALTFDIAAGPLPCVDPAVVPVFGLQGAN